MVKTRLRVFAIAAAAALVLGGCGGETAETEPETSADDVADEAATDDDADETPEEPTEAAEEPTEAADDAADEAADNLLPIETQTIETGGFVLTVENLGYLSRDDLGDDADEVLDDRTQTLLALDLTVENTTEDTLSIYPDQGTLVIGSEQTEAQFWLSDQVGGDFYGTVTKEGMVFFESSQDGDDIRDLGEVRYLVDGPHDEDLDRTGDDVDATISW
jgi:frataxin-like iron-binding protein CyaY